MRVHQCGRVAACMRVLPEECVLNMTASEEGGRLYWQLNPPLIPSFATEIT